MSEETKRGRPKKYSGQEYGAPRLTIRVDPDVHQYVAAQPEGARLYIERLVREDQARRKTSRQPTEKVEQPDEGQIQ